MSQPNISIRRGEPDDYRALCAIHAQPRAIWGTLQLPFPSIEQWRLRLDKQTDDFYFLVACSNDTLVGCAGLDIGRASPRRRHAGEIGMAVHDAWHAQGIGTALLGAIVDLADNWFNLLRLELTVYTDNAPAIALYKKYDFEIEGRLRKFSFRDGEYADVFTMARLNRALGTQAAPPR